MGGKAGTASSATGGETFHAVLNMMRQEAPEASEGEKWGTVHFELNGTLFALSSKRGIINCYILIPGIFREFASELGHLDQSSCCLRLEEGTRPPTGLRKVMKRAVLIKTGN